MSEENIEVLRAFVSAWNARDMDAPRELHDPDVIMQAPKGWPEPGPEIGRDAVLRQFEQLRETWEADSVEPISFVDVGDRVLMRFSWHTAGQGPGSHLEFTHVATVQNGKIVRQEYHWDHAEALETVGLSEQDAHAGP
jgi:ketosteroid isomerase-like protein